MLEIGKFTLLEKKTTMIIVLVQAVFFLCAQWGLDDIFLYSIQFIGMATLLHFSIKIHKNTNEYLQNKKKRIHFIRRITLMFLGIALVTKFFGTQLQPGFQGWVLVDFLYLTVSPALTFVASLPFFFYGLDAAYHFSLSNPIESLMAILIFLALILSSGAIFYVLNVSFLRFQGQKPWLFIVEKVFLLLLLPLIALLALGGPINLA